MSKIRAVKFGTDKCSRRTQLLKSLVTHFANTQIPDGQHWVASQGTHAPLPAVYSTNRHKF